jgi:hypothetical protein
MQNRGGGEDYPQISQITQIARIGTETTAKYAKAAEDSDFVHSAFPC